MVLVSVGMPVLTGIDEEVIDDALTDKVLIADDVCTDELELKVVDEKIVVVELEIVDVVGEVEVTLSDFSLVVEVKPTAVDPIVEVTRLDVISDVIVDVDPEA